MIWKYKKRYYGENYHQKDSDNEFDFLFEPFTFTMTVARILTVSGLFPNRFNAEISSWWNGSFLILFDWFHHFQTTLLVMVLQLNSSIQPYIRMGMLQKFEQFRNGILCLQEIDNFLNFVKMIIGFRAITFLPKLLLLWCCAFRIKLKRGQCLLFS